MADADRGPGPGAARDPAPGAAPPARDGAAAPQRPAVAWSWPACALGVVYALPAGVVSLHDPGRCMALAIGVLPAAVLGLPAARRTRLVIPVLGLAVGVSLLVGSALAHFTWVAVPGMFVLAVGAALLAARRRLGILAMTLCLPLAGAGLSFGRVADALETAVLIFAGSLYACLVCLAWPGRSGAPSPGGPSPLPPGDGRAALDYGLRLGAAGATATAVGLAWAPTHPGWPVITALMVMRPRADMQRLRSIGRVGAVLAGVCATVALLYTAPPGWAYGVTALVVTALTTATQGSRWYILPAFPTVLILLLLLQSEPGQESGRVAERIGATVVGVALAYVFGRLLPSPLGRRPR
ncbi:FUSC family protein [Streptomyces sp. NPDC051567]|uniref:FUSC family protein n=1 Tax=Streptomyces sp. NPDC051567 TaxID=3365660 RepID=UPI00378F41F4